MRSTSPAAQTPSGLGRAPPGPPGPRLNGWARSILGWVSTCDPRFASGSLPPMSQTHAPPSPGRAEEVTPAHLLGRDPELAALRVLLDEVCGGHSGAAFVCGEAGIGKTSVVEVLVSAARERGLRAVWGRCSEGGGASPFEPWAQILEICASGGMPIQE